MSKRIIPILLFVYFYFINSILFAETNSNKYDSSSPKIEAQEIEIIYSEDAIIKAKIKAQLAKTFKNNNIEFSKGVYVEFFNEKKKITATLTADYVIYDNKANIYRMQNNVKVKNIPKYEVL